MHELEGADYETVSGHRRYKDADPATVVKAVDMNAMHISLLKMVVDSGIGLAANGAGDISEGFVRLGFAVDRLINKASHSNFQMTSASMAFNPTGDTHGVTITEDASYSNGVITLNTGTTHDKRKISFLNTTTTTKIIDGGDGLIAIGPTKCVEVWARNESGTVKWRSMDGNSRGSFAVELRGSVDGLADTGTCWWAIRDGYAFLDIKGMVNTGITPQTYYISAASDAAFPSFLDVSSSYPSSAWGGICSIQDTGAKEIGEFSVYTASPGNTKVFFGRLSTSTITGPAGVIAISTSYRIR